MSRRPHSLPRQAAGLARQLPRPYGMQFRPPRGRTGRTMLGVLGALVLVLGAALLTDPEPVRAGSSPGTRVTVRSTIAVCPQTESLGDTRIAIAAPESPATDDSGAGERAANSTATVTKQGSKDRKSVLGISEPGTSAYLDLPAAPKTPLIAKATGAVAPGFTASETIRTSGDAFGRSLSGTPCPQAATEFWFLGPGSNEKSRSSWLYLINPENAPAQVDVQLFSDDGPVEASGLDALTLEPGGTKEKLLQVVAPPHERIAVHVVARVGRVAAALYDNAHDGLEPRGADWIPAVAAASTRVIVPAVPGGKGERTLYLFVPGDDGALAKLRLVGKNGTFSPAPPDKKTGPLDTIALEGNQLKQVTLSEVTESEPFGVLVEADRPLVAALRVGTGDTPPDIAYLAATPPLGGPSVVADARNADGMTSKLVFTAPGEPAKVTVTALVKGEQPRKVRDVEIKAGVSREISLSQIKGAFAIMITPLPGSGPVYASRVLSERSSDGDLLTIEQFQPSHTTALVPDVVNDLSAGLRPGE